jgi:NitT/TauT family transport system substrate-binding protein
MKIVVTPGGIGGGNGPFWAAINGGLFEDYGLDVEVREMKGGMRETARALGSGEVHIATLAAPALVQADLNGAGLVAIMGLMNKLGFQVMTQPEIKTVADLRGKTLASSRGSTDAVLWQWFLPRHGLEPGKDVRLAEIADTRDQMEALRKREIDGMTLSPAGSTYLKMEGFNELVNFEPQQIDFQLGCIVSSRQFVQKHPEETLAYLRGHVASMRRYKRDRELGLRTLRGYTGISDPEVLRITYETFARNFLDWPFPNVQGFETIIQALSQIDPRAKGHEPGEFIDAGPLEQLQKESFGDGL